MNIPIARTSLTDEEIDSVLAPLRSGWLVQGPKVKEFEEPVLVEDVLSWRKDKGHVIKTVEKTVDRVTWQDITKQSSWR